MIIRILKVEISLVLNLKIKKKFFYELCKSFIYIMNWMKND